MKHTIYTFTLHRRGVLWVIFALVVESVLLFGGGWLLGTYRAGRGVSAEGTSDRIASEAEPSEPQAVAQPGADGTPRTDTGSSQAPGTSDPAVGVEGQEKASLGIFAVQVAELVDEEAVQSLVDSLVERGYEAYFVTRVDAGERKAFGVRIGRFEQRAEASKAAQDFIRRESREAVVVREL